jgi:hypothetical protein
MTNHRAARPGTRTKWRLIEHFVVFIVGSAVVMGACARPGNAAEGDQHKVVGDGPRSVVVTNAHDLPTVTQLAELYCREQGGRSAKFKTMVRFVYHHHVYNDAAQFDCVLPTTGAPS